MLIAWASRSMRRFVDDFKKKNLPLHCLINNAGVENPPDRRTPEGLDVSYKFKSPVHIFSPAASY